MSPLAARMRPTRLDEIIGQDHLLGSNGPIRKALDNNELYSLILWGPPGCGKTTIARAISAELGLNYIQLSAVLDGVKQLRTVVAQKCGKSILFIDEIHRWNRTQQDALLPYVEEGEIILLGATTEHPGHSLTRALRSRVKIFTVNPLTDDQIIRILENALVSHDGFANTRTVQSEALRVIASSTHGDVRQALSCLERCLLAVDGTLKAAQAADLVQHSPIINETAKHDLMSAMIKSMRGSDVNASVYWLARLIRANEDPNIICRRLVVFASEDIGNADPRALGIAMDAAQAIQMIGMPEGRIVLSQAVTWLATSPKSDASYQAIDNALATVDRMGDQPEVPGHLRVRANTYQNPHRFPDALATQTYWPEKLDQLMFYRPTNRGAERVIRDRLEWWRQRLDGRHSAKK